MVELTNVISMGRDHTIRDIPQMLREMADRMESGEVEAQSVVFLIPRDECVDVFLWGDDLGRYGIIGVLEEGKNLFLQNDVARTS